MSTFRISFLGLGHVGLTSAVCFSSKGFKVVGFDIDEKKVDAISSGNAPFYEPRLDKLLRYSIRHSSLKVTTNLTDAITNSNITYITVNTPSKEDSAINLSQVEEASKAIGEALRHKTDWHLVVVKSTVIPTATENIIIPIIEKTSGKRCGVDFGICVNPEFLREGHAVEDTLNPHGVVIGEFNRESGDLLELFYRKFYDKQTPPLLRTTLVNAELIKYANNAFLAMKVSFINMIANLCQKLPNADIEDVAKGIGLDRRIGSLFLKAGAGWGGSCWPKDLKALLNFGAEKETKLPLIEATLEINEEQPLKLINYAKDLIGELKNRKISILGLSFKPNTDDISNAVSIKIIENLLEEGAKVTVYDPKAMDNAKRIFGNSVHYAKDVMECLRGSECALIVTEWNEFKNLTPEIFANLMKIPAVVDGRRIYDPKIFSPTIRFKTIGLGPPNLIKKQNSIYESVINIQ